MARISLQSNILSLLTQRRLAEASDGAARAMERLSSGLRINRASDDPAGLAMALRLNSDTRVLTQGVRNINDGLSALAVTEAALRELSSITQRQMELAEQAANGVYSLTQRRAMDKEVLALTNEYNRIVQSAEFNGFKLLDPTQGAGTFTIQAGSGQYSQISFSLTTELSRTIGDGTFDDSIYASLSNMRSVQTVDVNNDGILDILGTANGGLYTYLGNGDGTFQAYTFTDNGWFLDRVAVADLNGDGFLDVVASQATLAGEIFFGNGDGTFSGGQFLTGSVGDATIADFNNDGILDIAASIEGGTGAVNVYLGNGDGTFAALTTATLAGYSNNGLTAGDLNGDGILDLVSNSYQPYAGASITVLIGNGDGTFRSGATWVSANGWLGTDATLADVNHDGILDVIANHRDLGAWVSLGNGDGTFAAQMTVSGLPGGYLFSATDLNGDGNVDIATVSGTTLRVSYGNGDGTFGAVTSMAVASSAHLAIGDLNGDGAPDIVTVGYGSANLNVLIANTKEVSTIGRNDILTQESAQQSLVVFSEQLDRISRELGVVGAAQSRLTSAANALTGMRDGYAAAASRIMDVDVAQEAAELLRTQILQQSAAALLAQANQMPELVLKLLGG